ncbi:MAG: ATP-binding protein [Candidatus Asgardarchaeum sp.]
MTYEIDCLKDGIFSKSTLKPLRSVFNYDQEKKKIQLLVSAGEWFTVSGLRRTGKTTLARSTVATINDIQTIYVDMWGAEEHREIDIFLERLRLGIKQLAVASKIKSILRKVEGITFLGIVKVELKLKGELTITEALESLAKKKKVVLIIDEAQIALRSRRVAEFLASLHDKLSPNLSVIMAGSLISMKKIISTNKAMPLYGRIGDELILNPLNVDSAREFLLKGFEECNISVTDDIIDIGVSVFGGFAGWLNWYGRRVVLELLQNRKIIPFKIVELVESEARGQIYDEIARTLRDRKNIRLYLKILNRIANSEFITVSEAAKLINRDESTAVFYLSQLSEIGLIKKEERYYTIADPMIKRIARNPDFEKEVKIRI